MTDYDKVPVDRMQSNVKRYVENGKVHGDFLRNLLKNDLVGTFSHADLENQRNMDEWITFVYNELPAECWGSEESVNDWSGIK